MIFKYFFYIFIFYASDSSGFWDTVGHIPIHVVRTHGVGATVFGSGADRICQCISWWLLHSAIPSQHVVRYCRRVKSAYLFHFIVIFNSINNGKFLHAGFGPYKFSCTCGVLTGRWRSTRCPQDSETIQFAGDLNDVYSCCDGNWVLGGVL